MSHIIQNAEKLNQKYNHIDQTVKDRETNAQAWKDACVDFHETYDILAFPGGLAKAIELLKNQDAATISIAIIYLHADPYFHRSGYIKQTIIRLLKKAHLSQEQIAPLQEVLLLAIQHNGRREFIEYCRLANKITNAQFEQQIQKIITHAYDPRIISRAQQMLDAAKK